jgi:hypothetical protein
MWPSASGDGGTSPPRRDRSRYQAIDTERGAGARSRSLRAYLDLLDQRRLVAILGFFLEQHATRLFVPATLLDALARKRARARRSTWIDISAEAGWSRGGISSCRSAGSRRPDRR